VSPVEAAPPPELRSLAASQLPSRLWFHSCSAECSNNNETMAVISDTTHASERCGTCALLLLSQDALPAVAEPAGAAETDFLVM